MVVRKASRPYKKKALQSQLKRAVHRAQPVRPRPLCSFLCFEAQNETKLWRLLLFAFTIGELIDWICCGKWCQKVWFVLSCDLSNIIDFEEDILYFHLQLLMLLWLGNLWYFELLIQCRVFFFIILFFFAWISIFLNLKTVSFIYIEYYTTVWFLLTLTIPVLIVSCLNWSMAYWTFWKSKNLATQLNSLPVNNGIVSIFLFLLSFISFCHIFCSDSARLFILPFSIMNELFAAPFLELHSSGTKSATRTNSPAPTSRCLGFETNQPAGFLTACFV